MEAVIYTERLEKRFLLGSGEELKVLNDVRIQILKGRLTILKGRSGSGKTTLINMLSALDVPSSGEVVFMGTKLSECSMSCKEELRRYQMGFVFQSIALVPVMSAYENVDFALRLAGYRGDRDRRIREVLGQVGLAERMHHLASRLSGGEQQRVAIARAVSHHPAVIFADEPTAALDTASGYAVMELFRQMVEKEGVTIVMTTHNSNLMELGDEVLELEDGKILPA